MSSLAPVVHRAVNRSCLGGFADLLMYWWMGAEPGLGGASTDAITVSTRVAPDSSLNFQSEDIRLVISTPT